MKVQRNKILEFMNGESVSRILKSLRDNKELRNTFSAEFGIILPDKLVFHGSPMEIESVNAGISLGGANPNKKEALIYAASEPDYAIFLALINLEEDGEASVTCENGEVKKSITVGFVNGGSKIRQGYLYVMDAEYFVAHENSEFTSNVEKLEPVFFLDVLIDDLETPIIISNS